MTVTEPKILRERCNVHYNGMIKMVRRGFFNMYLVRISY